MDQQSKQGQGQDAGKRKKDDATGETKEIGRRAWSATVFHISQTDPAKV